MLTTATKPRRKLTISTHEMAREHFELGDRVYAVDGVLQSNKRKVVAVQRLPWTNIESSIPQERGWLGTYSGMDVTAIGQATVIKIVQHFELGQVTGYRLTIELDY